MEMESPIQLFPRHILLLDHASIFVWMNVTIAKCVIKLNELIKFETISQTTPAWYNTHSLDIVIVFRVHNAYNLANN